MLDPIDSQNITIIAETLGEIDRGTGDVAAALDHLEQLAEIDKSLCDIYGKISMGNADRLNHYNRQERWLEVIARSVAALAITAHSNDTRPDSALGEAAFQQVEVACAALHADVPTL